MPVRGALAGALVLVILALAGCGSDETRPGTARAVWRPPPVNAEFDYQIGGAYPPASGVMVVARDRHAPPARGQYGICYLNAFQTQRSENDWWKLNHRDLLLRTDGGYAEDPNWPGELILDLSTAAKRTAIAAIVNEWIAGCAKSGYQAIEPDNFDSWTRSEDKLTRAHALEFAGLLIASAHRHGLAIAQKNAPELTGSGRRAGFDFVIAEECAVSSECDRYTSAYGDHVIDVEYTDNPRRYYARACASYGRRISMILRDRDVAPRGDPAYRYEHC